MAKTALFVKLNIKPGKREEVKRLWEKYVKPHSVADKNQERGYYCYGQDENTICLFELFSEGYNTAATMEKDWFKAYSNAVGPLLASPSEVVFGYPVWVK